MGMVTQILTFGASAVQFPVPNDIPTVHTVSAEPLRTNTHPCWIGTSAVTNDGSGTGVMTQLATPPAATVPVDRWSYQPSTDGNRVDPTGFWAHGTSGEKLIVSYLKV